MPSARISKINMLNSPYMFSSFIRVLSLLSLVALFGLGCNSASDTNGSATTTGSVNTTRSGNPPVNTDSPLVISSPNQAEPPEQRDNWRTPGSAASLCDHPYYPLRTGYEITYHNFYREPTDVVGRTRNTDGKYTVKVTQSSNNNAVLKFSFNGSAITATQTIDCTQQGLVAKGYVDLSSLQRGRGTGVRTTEVAGFILPRDLHVGSTWTQSFSFSTELPGSALQTRGIPVDGKVEIRRKAIGEGVIETEAGRFTAIIVETTTESAMEIPGQGSVPFIYQGREYWVRGKGLVKTESWMDDSPFSATAQAENITIP